MNRKVFITLAIGFLLTFNAHSTPTMTNERQANAKLLFKAKLRAAWANGPALAPDISSRFAKQGVITDGVSTALALAGGAKELNPLLGASPSPLTLVGFTAIKVAYVNHLTLRPNQQAQARAAGLCALGSLGDGATANTQCADRRQYGSPVGDRRMGGLHTLQRLHESRANCLPHACCTTALG